MRAHYAIVLIRLVVDLRLQLVGVGVAPARAQVSHHLVRISGGLTQPVTVARARRPTGGLSFVGT